MLIVGINGSPKKDGNTKYLINYILERAKEEGSDTEIIDVSEVLASSKTPFCTSCSSPCKGICYKGTKLEQAYELITRADGLIVGSPVYFGTVSAQLKAFFDKTRGYRTIKSWVNKIGAGAAVGGSPYGGQETTIRAIHDILFVQGMMIVGDGYKENDSGHFGVCAKNPVEDDLYALKRADIIAKRMVEVCEATKTLRS